MEKNRGKSHQILTPSKLNLTFRGPESLCKISPKSNQIKSRLQP